MEFLVQSQTNPNTCYALNLSFECCECNDQVNICKHMLDVWMLLDWELKHLKLLLSSNKEGFLHAVHENFEVEASIQAGRSMENNTILTIKKTIQWICQIFNSYTNLSLSRIRKPLPTYNENFNVVNTSGKVYVAI